MTGPLKRETILLVDDEINLRRILQALLEDQGFRVIGATTGPEALAAARSVPEAIDLVITDMLMPGMNGVELAQQLQQQHPGLRVLFISGFPDDDSVRRTSLDPNASFLFKPFTASALLGMARKILGPPKRLAE